MIKTAVTLLVVAGAALGARAGLSAMGIGCSGGTCPISAAVAFFTGCGECADCTADAADAGDATVRGQYVEARSATVFAGACHYQGEYASRGREAVLAWRLESGAHDGVSLAGVNVVAALAGDDNLDRAESARRSVVWVDEAASEAQREAALSWLRAKHATALGEIAAVHSAPVAIEREGDRFRVRAGDAVELAGAGLPDRACCTMPYEVWYRPFAAVEQPLVGRVDAVRCDDPSLRAWSSSDENSAFFGAIDPLPQG
jgi:hypothetical protein